MELQIIPRKEIVPDFDRKEIQLRHIKYFDAPYNEYEEEEITEEVVEKVLKKIPEGLNIYLSLVPYGEDDWLEVNCDGEWLALGYCSCSGTRRKGCYFSYNAAFAHTADRLLEADFFDKSIYTPLNSGGQSPIPKIQAITDMEAGLKAVEYFIWTGELYPGIDWLHEL